MDISKLKGKPHMHIVRKWNRKTGKFYWAAEEQGCRSWPVATHVRGPDNHYAQAFAAYLNMKEDECKEPSTT